MEVVTLNRLILGMSVFILLFEPVHPDECQSPQYMEFGRQGSIRCVFPDTFFKVVWYYSGDTSGPFLEYKPPIASGRGFNSGEYDIHPNGSLIIQNVTLNHERTFNAVMFLSDTSAPTSNDIDVIVIKRPSSVSPVIMGSSGVDHIHFREILPTQNLTCGINDSRPAIPLSWEITIPNDDHNTSFAYDNKTDSGFSSSFVTAVDLFADGKTLKLLICKSDDPLDLLGKNESSILVQNEEIDLTTVGSEEKIVKSDSTVKLQCSGHNNSLIVWKKQNSTGQLETIVYVVSVDHDFSRFLKTDPSVSLDSDGALVIDTVKVEHEGAYVCIRSDKDGQEDINLIDLGVYIDPVPAHPVVTGCNNPKQYCTLEVEREGNLTCTIKGIRPTVEPKWTVFDEKQAEMITFENEKTKIIEYGDTNDIILTSEYKIQPSTPDNRIILKCIGSGPHAEHFQLSSTFDIQFTTADTLNEPEAGLKPWGIGVIIGVVVLVLLVLVIVVVKWKNHRKIKKNKQGDLQNEEEMVRLTEEIEEKKQLTKDQSDFELFTTQIRGKYQDFYQAIKPIPYLADKMYSVHQVFVEGGLKVLSKANIGQDKWEEISSYREMFSADERLYIIEGEAGYGKTTLTLQLAYEWCTKSRDSSIGSYELLILLRLRELTDIASLYKAIKQCILPKDTPFTEEDIERIINNSQSVMIILDGFDEYTSQDNGADSNDVMDILKNRMLMDTVVVVTTRPSTVLRRELPPAKVMQMTGFDKQEQVSYLRKAGPKDETAQRKIMEYLEKNPVVSDICQTPLFFAIFTHVSSEDKTLMTFVTSVTSFFRYIITSFHFHQKNKIKEDQGKLDEAERFEVEYEGLSKVAFDGLCENGEINEWRKGKMTETLGKEFLKHYVEIGVLVKLKKVNVGGTLGRFVDDSEKISFYHRLFCEWYAAQHLADEVGSILESRLDANDSGQRVERILENLDPFRRQYTFRFACGLKKEVADPIISYVRKLPEGEKFAVLCAFEQGEELEDIRKTVRDLCSNVIHISNNDSRLQRRSTLQLLGIASVNQIPIAGVWISDSFKSVGDSKEEILLDECLRLPVLNTIKELCIDQRGKKISLGSMSGILQFSENCPKLRKLRFENCLVPFSVEKSSLEAFRNREGEVSWFGTQCWHDMDLTTGCWKNRDSGKLLESDGYDGQVTSFKEFHTWNETDPHAQTEGN